MTIGILIGTLAAWVIFELSGYTLLSLVSNVLLLLLSILFVWAKCAEILNRPSPSIPPFHLSEEAMKEAAALVGSQVNVVLTVFHDIALGKDPKLFHRVAMWLMLISVVGSCMDFLPLAYTSLVLLLTFPVLYETFEDTIDRYVILALVKLHMYERVYAECFSKAKEWIIEILKES